MTDDCEGLIIRQTKILKGRRMLLLLTDRFGKISAGTSVSERGKSKSALALRPFTVGRYILRRNSGFTNITAGETLKSYYALSEDYGRFINASVALEMTSKALPEDAPAGDIYTILIKFLDMMLVRKCDFDTPLCAYIVKLLALCGVLPHEDDFKESELILTLNSDIVEVLVFLRNNPLERVENLTLDSEIAAKLRKFLIEYAETHLDIKRLNSILPSGELSERQP